MVYNRYKKKKTKTIGNFIVGLLVGILTILGVGAGVFFGIPSVKANIANKLVNESSIYKDAVGENETLKTDNQALQTDIENKNTEIEGLNNDKIELNDLIDELNSDNDSLNSINRDLKNQNRDLLQQIAMIQGSNSCEISLENQYYSMTPDGPGYIWLSTNTTGINNYYMDMNNSSRSNMINNLTNESFSGGIHLISIYRIRIPELNIDQTFSTEKWIYNEDNSKIHVNVVDVLGNRYENFDNFTTEFGLKFVIRDIDYEARPNDNYNFTLTNLDADIIVVNPVNYTLQNVYRNGDNTFIFDENNMTYIYKNYAGRYYHQGNNIIRLNQMIDNEFNFIYLTSNNSILVGDEMFIANNAHYVEVDESIKKYVNIDPLMFAQEGEIISFNVKDTFTTTVDTVQIIVGDNATTITADYGNKFSFTMPNEDVRIVATYKDIVFENYEYDTDPTQSIVELDLSNMVAGEYKVNETTDSYPTFNIYISSDTKIQTLNLQLRARYNIYFNGTVSEFNSSFCGNSVSNWIDKYSRARYVYCNDGQIRITLNQD